MTGLQINATSPWGRSLAAKIHDGYHGTSAVRADLILANGFEASSRRGLWLGSGVYFFLDAPGRAEQYAQQWGPGSSETRKILRADISLETCMDLTDVGYWEFLRDLYRAFATEIEDRVQQDLATKGRTDQTSFSEYLHMLKTGQIDPLAGYNVRDCHLLNLAYGELSRRGRAPASIKAAFAEGRPIHPSSWLFDEASVMVCVKDLSVVGAPAIWNWR